MPVVNPDSHFSLSKSSKIQFSDRLLGQNFGKVLCFINNCHIKKGMPPFRGDCVVELTQADEKDLHGQ